MTASNVSGYSKRTVATCMTFFGYSIVSNIAEYHDCKNPLTTFSGPDHCTHFVRHWCVASILCAQPDRADAVTDKGPAYTAGFAATMSMTALGVVIAQALRFWLRRRNLQRDREANGVIDTSRGTQDLTDFENRNIRYAL